MSVCSCHVPTSHSGRSSKPIRQLFHAPAWCRKTTGQCHTEGVGVPGSRSPRRRQRLVAERLVASPALEDARQQGRGNPTRATWMALRRSVST